MKFLCFFCKNLSKTPAKKYGLISLKNISSIIFYSWKKNTKCKSETNLFYLIAKYTTVHSNFGQFSNFMNNKYVKWEGSNFSGWQYNFKQSKEGWIFYFKKSISTQWYDQQTFLIQLWYKWKNRFMIRFQPVRLIWQAGSCLMKNILFLLAKVHASKNWGSYKIQRRDNKT